MSSLQARACELTTPPKKQFLVSKSALLSAPEPIPPRLASKVVARPCALSLQKRKKCFEPAERRGTTEERHRWREQRRGWEKVQGAGNSAGWSHILAITGSHIVSHERATSPQGCGSFLTTLGGCTALRSLEEELPMLTLGCTYHQSGR